eukprot:353825_1
MGGCISCCCMNCIMDSYLHLYIRDITNTHFQKGDINISGARDIAVRVCYQGYVQDSKIINNEVKSIAFNEPIIIENGRPSTTDELKIEVYDVDQCTADDLLGIAIIPLPVKYGENIGERQYDIKAPGYSTETVGKIRIDHIHFIKQKIVRYMGPCKCFCCCLETGEDAEEASLL